LHIDTEVLDQEVTQPRTVDLDLLARSDQFAVQTAAWRKTPESQRSKCSGTVRSNVISRLHLVNCLLLRIHRG
jgi:hypothetical protein